MLPRIHGFEWEDQPWLPRVFRDFITDHLRFSLNESMRRPINLAIAQRLKDLLERGQTRQIVDLCSGAGGPLPAISRILLEQLHCPVDVLLTDLYPNVVAFKRIEKESGGTVAARYESISAAAVPVELRGVRTLFTALHHFKPEQVRQILADAAEKRASIAVFEPLERTLRLVILVGLISFVRGFTHTPRVGKLTLRRFLVTYLVPLAPAIFAWDGMVSVVRTYTPDELREIAASLETHQYEWEAGRFEVAGPYGPMPTTYLVGVPEPRAD